MVGCLVVYSDLPMVDQKVDNSVDSKEHSMAVLLVVCLVDSLASTLVVNWAAYSVALLIVQSDDLMVVN